MPDPFLIFTPLLVFAIVALLAFVGCQLVFNLDEVPPLTTVTRVFQQTGNPSGGKGPFTASYTPASSDTNLLVLISLHWASSGSPPPLPDITVNGALPTQVTMDNFNPQSVAHFFANNLSGPINASVGLTANSNTAWDFCVTIYSNADQSSSPLNSPISRQGTAQGTIPDAANQLSITSTVDHLIYAVAVSQSGGGVLGGNLAPGTDFVSVASPIGFFLVEELSVTQQTTQPVVPSANVSGGARWYFFAADIKNASG
jgi:hypothetical protein